MLLGILLGMDYREFEDRRRKLDQEAEDFYKFLIVVGIIVGVLVLIGLGVSIYNAFTY